MPIRKQGFRMYFRKYWVINPSKWQNFSIARKIATAVIPLFILVFFTGITGVVGEAQQDTKENYPTNIKINGEEQHSAKDTQEKNKVEEEVGTSVENNDEASQPEKDEPSVNPMKEPYKELLAIGDSVMIDIATRLHTLYLTLQSMGKSGDKSHKQLN